MTLVSLGARFAGRIGWLAERAAVDLDPTAERVDSGVGMGVAWGTVHTEAIA